jgi:perosamine synthetase
MVHRRAQPRALQGGALQHLSAARTNSASRIADDVVGMLREVLGAPTRGPIPLHEPEITDHERRVVDACLASGSVSSVGDCIGALERRLARVTGAAHAVAVGSGTAALQLALHAAGVRPGDEVLVPTLSFVATANAVAHCGATPHFVDADADSLGIDPDALRRHLARVARRAGPGASARCEHAATGRRIAALVPMHTFGHASRIAELCEVAREWGLPVVEDAAESLGTTVGAGGSARHTGTFGLLGTLSFNGNKTVTTGGGGAVLTDDEALAARVRHLATTAKRPHAWEYVHDEVAWNHRMPNLNAALGVAQMDRLDDMLSRKRALAARYERAAAALTGCEVVAPLAGTTSNRWLVALRLDAADAGATRDAVLAAAHAAGYLCRPAWQPLHTLPMYETAPRAALDVATRLHASLFNVPSSARLGGAPGPVRGSAA